MLPTAIRETMAWTFLRAMIASAKAGTSANGKAAICPRASFERAGRRLSRWPRQRAGFSPVRWPFALAASRIASIRPRSRDAVSVFVVQIGFNTSSTSSVPIASTGFPCSAAAYSRIDIRHWSECFALRHEGAIASM